MPGKNLFLPVVKENASARAYPNRILAVPDYLVDGYVIQFRIPGERYDSLRWIIDIEPVQRPDPIVAVSVFADASHIVGIQAVVLP